MKDVVSAARKDTSLGSVQQEGVEEEITSAGIADRYAFYLES